MSIPCEPKKAKLVISLFMKEKKNLLPVSERLESQFGPIDLVSSWLDFNFTSYYESEMGSPLFRRVLAFNSLINQEDLSLVKVFTNNIEKEYSENNKRLINIDPGYLLLERFVLASGKNFAHRIYIGEGIYADLTLIYQKGSFYNLPWTYPDYGAENMKAFLTVVRKKYKNTLNAKKQSL